MQLNLHFRFVGLPFATLSVHVEGVGVWVYKYAGKLPPDDTAYEVAQRLVLTHIPQVGPNLSRTVAKPHGVDVPGVHEGVVVSAGIAVVYGGVEGVGEAVDEHPVEFGVYGCQFRLKVEYLLLYCLAAEQAFLFCRAQILDSRLRCHLFLRHW